MRPCRVLPAVVLLAMAGLPGTVAAQVVTVDVNEDLAAQYGIDAGRLESELTESFDKELHLADMSGYLAGMANAAALSTRGIGVDYATSPTHFISGGSLGTAVNKGGGTLGRGGKELPEFGFAFQAAVMMGLNLGAFDEDRGFFDRWVVYVNWLMADTHQVPVEGSLHNFGAHLQLELIRSRDGKVLEWGGVDLTGGYEWSYYALDLAAPLPVKASADDVEIVWKATGTYFIESVGRSVPLEASTSVRLLFLTGFAGLGVDLTDVSARSKVSLGGRFNVDVRGESVELGGVNAHVSDIGRGAQVVPRVFGGLQLDLWMLKLYGQLNYGFNQTFGGHAGVRAGF